MLIRLKKLVGTIILILIVIIYPIFATAYASLHLAQSSGWVHLAFFLVTGLLWILPAMVVIRWMSGPPAKGADRIR